MIFCSQSFLLFFAVVLAVYWLTPMHRVRVWILVLASFAFYAAWNHWLAVLITVSTVADFLMARAIDRSESDRFRKGLVWTSVLSNLGLLFYFKYANFFLESLDTLLHTLGTASSIPLLHVLLPIGISFYTFEAINYMVDVYKRKIPAERNLPNFMLFILFFPHLIAGPIVRAKDFLPQITRRKRWSWPRIQLGLQYFVLGMAKKMLIADRMATYSDPVFKDPTHYGTGAVWLALLAYSVQIYCDFDGYTDMAIGTAHMLGYKLAKNFNLPYIAVNIADYWQRWHLSLSHWLRDYVFMPLCFRGPRRAPPPATLRGWAWSLLTGSRRGDRWRLYHAQIVTMLVCGIWHGATWNFVLSGLLHGLMLVGHRLFGEWCSARAALSRVLTSWPGTFVRWAITMLFIALIYVLFRAPTFGIAAGMYQGLFSFRSGLGPPAEILNYAGLMAVFVLGHVLALKERWRPWLESLPAPVLGVGQSVAMMLVLLCTPDSANLFVYFQF